MIFEVDFKAYDKLTGQVLDVTDVVIRNHDVVAVEIDLHNDDTRRFRNASEVALMPWTGREDYRGNRIYADQILMYRGKYSGDWCLARVFFLNGAFRISTFDVLTTDIAKKTFIVGDIHQKPHLLDDETKGGD